MELAQLRRRIFVIVVIIFQELSTACATYEKPKARKKKITNFIKFDHWL